MVKGIAVFLISLSVVGGIGGVVGSKVYEERYRKDPKFRWQVYQWKRQWARNTREWRERVDDWLRPVGQSRTELAEQQELDARHGEKLNILVNSMNQDLQRRKGSPMGFGDPAMNPMAGPPPSVEDQYGYQKQGEDPNNAPDQM